MQSAKCHGEMITTWYLLEERWTRVLTVFDRIHREVEGLGVVVGVSNRDGRVLLPEPVEMPPEHCVVVPGQSVELPQAAGPVAIVRRVFGMVESEVEREATHR